MIFKMMLLGYFYGITSERRLAEECSLHLAFRWYLGYDLDEATPNHSVLSKARSRYGKDVFEKFFEHVLRRCVEAGLVKGERIFADSTLIDADASVRSLVDRDSPAAPLVFRKNCHLRLAQIQVHDEKDYMPPLHGASLRRVSTATPVCQGTCGLHKGTVTQQSGAQRVLKDSVTIPDTSKRTG